MTARPRLSRMARHEARLAKIYLIPAFLGLTFLTYLPLLAVFAMSLFKWTAIMPRPLWNGVQNYVRLFTRDMFFWTSVRVTI